ncbi:hypothetical protein [Bdellovibrio sp. HCB209]|uniref:hypothetical protein n=1 Tax=Bdellovibrio sp. HCB209 TaxID=3394354 RepID=UPI0039B456BF
MKNLLSVISVLLFPLFLSAQQKITGELFDFASEQKQKLYDLNLVITPQGAETIVQSEFRDIHGNIAVTEKGVVSGDKLVSFEIVRKQTNESGKILVDGDKLSFEYFDTNGKKKTAEEKVKGFVLCSSNFGAFVKSNWEAFKKGDSVSVRFAVWDRLETVGFTIRKIKNTEIKGEKVLELEMKPTSFVIAALVDPVRFYYSESDQNLRMMKGRVPPKVLRDGKWKDLDAEVVYTMVQSSVSK